MTPSPRLSGRLATLQPWQWIIVAVVFAIAVSILPALYSTKKEHRENEVSQARVAVAAGEEWRSPSIPPEVLSKPEPKPTPSPILPIVAKPADLPRPSPVASAAITRPAEIPDYRMAGNEMQPVVNQGGQLVNQNGQSVNANGQPVNSPLGDALRPTVTSGFSASRIGKPWATISEGRVIQCRGVTAMNSSLPGMVKAKVLDDIRSDDGSVVLIDRNSEVTGEIGRTVAQGQERLFVLWRMIRTPPPFNVRIRVNSPAADELGEAGLEGEVDRHLWRKIEGALLLSGIETASAAAVAALQGNGNSGGGGPYGGGGINFYSFQNRGNSLASEMVRHQFQIPDTIRRGAALPCSIFVASDLDFSTVYHLERRR